MNYEINNDNFKIRQENNETISFLNLKTMNIVFLNEIASLIFKHSELRSLEDFSNFVSSLYPNTDRKIIEKDCYDLIYKMDALEILKIEEEANIDKDTFIAGESDYSAISRFIKNCIKIKDNTVICSSFDLNHYSAYALRVRQFKNLEFNFIHCNKEKAIDALITVAPNPGGSAFVINNIFLSTDNFQVLKKIIDYIFLTNAKLTKVRIMISGKVKGNLKKVLQYLNFKQEAELKFEYDNESLFCYALYRLEV